MKKILIVSIIGMFLSLVFPASSSGQASDATWTSSLIYFTTSDEPGHLSVSFFDGSNVYESPQLEIGPKSSGEIRIGSTLPDGFKGSAVLSSTIPVYSVYSQFEENAPYQYSRAFYSGFSIEDAGSQFFLATTRSNGITETTIGVQNVESFEITATLDFYSVWTGQIAFTYIIDLAPNATYLSKLPEIPTYPGGIFDGSLVVTATRKGDPFNEARVVASAVETQDKGFGVYSYQGVKAGKPVSYLPSAMCDYIGQTSYYAIQNLGDFKSAVVIDYYDKYNRKVGSMPTKDIEPGAKLSTNPCINGFLVGMLGSAVVRSTNNQPLIAMGKIHTNDGLITAFSGLYQGSTRLALPFIRWSDNESTDYRSYVSVMNLGNENARNIVAIYYDADGTEVVRHVLASDTNQLAPFFKANTNPQSAGALLNGSFGYIKKGGAVEIISDQPVVALVRNATWPKGITGIRIFGEDYNGLIVRD